MELKDQIDGYDLGITFRISATDFKTTLDTATTPAVRTLTKQSVIDITIDTKVVRAVLKTEN